MISHNRCSASSQEGHDVSAEASVKPSFFHPERGRQRKEACTERHNCRNMRLLRSVAPTVPCVAGQYAGISCTLQLLDNTI
jgi:hypothetical protein